MKCKICGKRMWFWQTAVCKEVVGVLLPPVYKKTAHLKCVLKKESHSGGTRETQ